MEKNLEDGTRAQIADFLPDAIETALLKYMTFMDGECDTPKKYKEHQGACKVALAHVNLLLDLARWVDEGGENEQGDAALMTLINKAKQELEGREEKLLT
jgi:hypothetical protein